MENKALQPNPYLQPLEVLVGTWKTVGEHPLVPNTPLHGRVVFEWIMGGAFLKVSSTIDHPDFPDGLAIIGSDNKSGQIYQLYFDERGISRKYDFSIADNQWKWWRDDAEFSQRFTVTIDNDGTTMTGTGEMCKKGSDWEGDLNLRYYRIQH